MDDDASLLDEIRQARVRLLETVVGVADDALRSVPVNETWSAIELLGHLVDVDYFYLSEALATCAQPGRPFSYFDDRLWKVLHPRAASESTASVLSRLSRSHDTVLNSLRLLTARELAITALHPRGIDYTVEAIFRRFPAHDQAHAAQLSVMLAVSPRASA